MYLSDDEKLIYDTVAGLVAQIGYCNTKASAAYVLAQSAVFLGWTMKIPLPDYKTLVSGIGISIYTDS